MDEGITDNTKSGEIMPNKTHWCIFITWSIKNEMGITQLSSSLKLWTLLSNGRQDKWQILPNQSITRVVPESRRLFI